MDDYLKGARPKKIKMPPLVDRSQAYDTLSFDNDTLYEVPQAIDNEDHPENNTKSLPELESL